VSLLLRFYQPTRGEIRFDRLPASRYELGSLRERIGYVSQSPLLMAGTIRENLRYGNPLTSKAEIERAVQIAEIQDFIQGLPDGYETAIGERGVNLSEGQKQRLCIARALIKDPDILIMDEPTSALDAHVEQSILEVLPGALKGKTIFVITHRLSTISKGDRILLLNQGGMEAIGTHQDLLARSDYYRSLFQGV
jgi:ABC-type multidrug transport system fused ATPase/permease subunit